MLRAVMWLNFFSGRISSVVEFTETFMEFPLSLCEPHRNKIGQKDFSFLELQLANGKVRHFADSIFGLGMREMKLYRYFRSQSILLKLVNFFRYTYISLSYFNCQNNYLRFGSSADDNIESRNQNNQSLRERSFSFQCLE